MRIACLGGGPAGLYFAISVKLREPDHEVHVFERNPSGVTFGWGVVFSDQTLENLSANDPESASRIAESFARWDDIEVRIGDQVVISSGHGFIGIGRRMLLQILQKRAAALGVVLHFETEFSDDLSRFGGFDLIVAADGVNSRIRTRHAEKFGVDAQMRKNKFTWLGTTRPFNAFSFIFERTDAGWIWAHAYRFDDTHSTFIVECEPETWTELGLDRMDQAESIAFCEDVFKDSLQGHRLLSNAGHLRGSAAWINFRRVSCERWWFDNVVLLGDAAHTAHFSIGSGTKLALEDAIKLAAAVTRPKGGGLGDRLANYQAEREVEVLRLQSSARNSTEWFESVDRYAALEAGQFAYSLLTRSQRVSHENLRIRDRRWLETHERWFMREAGLPVGDEDRPAPPLFTPFKLRGMTLANRLVMSPMLTYQSHDDGRASDFHLGHYWARAQGGTGLIMTEMLAVAPQGRSTPACAGIYEERHIDGWGRLNELIHSTTPAKTCAQIGHAGARASCRVPKGVEDFDRPLDQPWTLESASARPWREPGLRPLSLDREGMERVVTAFEQAARRAAAADFDMLEIQAGHGFLLSSFITPVMNDRDDEHGGCLGNRLRFPLRVIEAVRAVWPDDRPLAVRISANDWVGETGVTPDEAVEIARRMKAAGADIIDVSAGETSPSARPVYGRLFQTPFADQVRNEAGIPTIAVGNILEADQVNSILAAGRADLVALGRPLMLDPSWMLRAAAEAGVDMSLDAGPRLGFEQLRRHFSKHAEAAQV